MQGNIILFMKTLQQSSWPLLSMYCLQLFARDSVSYTQCQLDTGNDQQNYARPTIQCISNYSNSTSTIEKNNTIHGPSLHHSSWFHQQHVRVIFPWSFPHVGLTWKWHIFPKKIWLISIAQRFHGWKGAFSMLQYLLGLIFDLTFRHRVPARGCPSNSTGIPWAP